jgi:isoquinoline 1-oxidoreductase subunit beta
MATMLGRTNFLRLMAGGSAALVLGLRVTSDGLFPIVSAAEAAAPDVAVVPSTWVTIDRDESVTIVCSHAEMGQGVVMGLPTILADELDASFERVKVVFAVPGNKLQIDPIYGVLSTGGSVSTFAMWPIMRQAGATARAMLITAAAQQWKVDPSSLTTANGVVTHAASNRTATYGSLTAAAAALPVPKNVPLKTPDKFTLIGKVSERIDLRPKTRGQTQYGIDVRVPGMLYAAVKRPPVFGGTVASFDGTKAKAIRGVRHVTQISSGIAVVADNTWAAMQGADAVEARWDEGPFARESSEKLLDEARRLALVAPQYVSPRSVGDVEQAHGTVLDAVYHAPFVAHAAMEPMNATASVEPESVTVWAPTQAPSRAQLVAAKITGLPPEKVTIHSTFLGGGFGRRLDVDYVQDAVEVSKAIGKPVKVQYTRADDLQHDFYRPMSVNHLRGVISDGRLIALSHTVVAKSVLRRYRPQAIKNGIDFRALHGADEIPYVIPNFRVTYVDHQHAVPVGFWRAPGANVNTFATEVFMDQLAHKAGKDPVAFRLALLEKAPRAAAVLNLVAEKAYWGHPEAGHHQGVAMVSWAGTVGALVADVTMQGKLPKVHRVDFAVDVGTVINPDIVVQQGQGAVHYGLSMAMVSKITIAEGRVQERNFDDFKVLKGADAPRVAVHIVPSTEKPTGIGEPGTAPIAPAVANAIFEATGKHVHSLPFADSLA